MPDTTHRLGLIAVLIVAVALVSLTVLVIVVGRDPVIETLEPAVVSPGEEVAIVGRSFGPVLDTLSLSGREVPSSSIVSWEDQEIRFVVPDRANSGMVYVTNSRGRSRGQLLRIRESVPRTSITGEGPGVPVITGIDTDQVVVGGVMTLTGTGFGRTRRGSRVVFPVEGDAACVPCAEDLSYAAWSDTSITVRVPHGVESGFLSVVTPWGASNPIRFLVERPAGRMVAENPGEIAVRYGARLDAVSLNDTQQENRPGERDIVLRLPSAAYGPAQRSLRYLDDRASQYRFESVSSDFSREVIRTVIVDRYSLRSEIDPARVSAAYESQT
ncbi:MAG: hypothetical protein ACOCY8_07680, partial [Spirochaetota bacterium]